MPRFVLQSQHFTSSSSTTSSSTTSSSSFSSLSTTTSFSSLTKQSTCYGDDYKRNLYPIYGCCCEAGRGNRERFYRFQCVDDGWREMTDDRRFLCPQVYH